MAGKFMKIRRICVPILTMVVIASQLCGCASSTKKETANMFNVDTSQEIIIEVSEPDFEVKGEFEQLNWIELGKLTDCTEVRDTADMYFNNAMGDDGLKYGPFYIDKDGNQCTNNTLKVVLGNRYVAEMFATGGTVDIEKIDSSNLGAIEIPEETTEGTETTDEETSAMTKSFNNSLDAVYTDLSDSDYTPALFNAYFNLLPDSTPNYFNGGDTLSRSEAMALVTRATTPVQSLTAEDDFTSAVEGTDYDQYINYAAQQNANSYINTNDKSLTADNFKGAMSRAEFIYLIMNEVYGIENVQSYDTTSSALKDCTNAGDLSAELKIAGSDRCNGYTLSHSLKNVDKGVTEELYKPLAMAVDKGIITPETRWNEGITKSEAIEIVVNAFSQYYDENGYLVNNADKGSTQVLEAQAEELWNKQDANDLSCTKEEFIADYVKAINNGVTPEEFEEGIGRAYSISYAEELAKIEEEERKKQEEAVKKAEEEAKAAEEAQKQQEQQSSSNGDGGGSSNNGGGNTGGGSSNGGGNTGGGTGNGGGTSGRNDTPVYNPPSDNGGSNNNGGNSTVVDELPDGFFDIPDGLDDWGDQSDWESWE